MHQTSAAVLRTRCEQVRRHGKRRGLMTDAAIAAYLGISPTTVWRLLRGDIKPGEHIIAVTLAAFPELKFEDLFEVVLNEPEVAA